MAFQRLQKALQSLSLDDEEIPNQPKIGYKFNNGTTPTIVPQGYANSGGNENVFAKALANFQGGDVETTPQINTIAPMQQLEQMPNQATPQPSILGQKLQNIDLNDFGEPPPQTPTEQAQQMTRPRVVQQMPDLSSIGVTEPNVDQQIQQIQNKDYGIRTDDNGNVIRGKDRDKNWSIWEKLLGIGLGFAEDGVRGAVRYGSDRNFREKMRDDQELNRLGRNQMQQREIAMRDANINQQNAQTAQIPIKTRIDQSKAETDFMNGVTSRLRYNLDVQKRDDKISQDEIDQNNKEIDRQIGVIKTVGKYRKGDFPQLDRLLESAGIVMPNFDTTTGDQPYNVIVKDENGKEQTVTVKASQALNYLGQVAQANANIANQAGMYNTSQANQGQQFNVTKQTQYDDDYRKYEQDVATADGEFQSNNQGALDALKRKDGWIAKQSDVAYQIEQLRNKGELTEEEEKRKTQLEKELNDINREIDKAQKESDDLNVKAQRAIQLKKGLKPPTKPKEYKPKTYNPTSIKGGTAPKNNPLGLKL